MAQHNDFGKKGEELACSFLEENNFKILEKNWRFRSLEIDIIAQSNDAIHIVEVKTRKTDFFGSPEEFVTITKQKNLITSTNEYLRNHTTDLNVQFDIIAIILNNNKLSIKYIENAFYPLA